MTAVSSAVQCSTKEVGVLTRETKESEVGGARRYKRLSDVPGFQYMHYGGVDQS